MPADPNAGTGPKLIPEVVMVPAVLSTLLYLHTSKMSELRRRKINRYINNRLQSTQTA